MSEIIDVNTLFGPLPASASDLSVDDLVGLMKEHSVSLCCTLSTIGVLLDHNAGNSATKAACSESSSLVPVTTINPLAFFGGDGPHNRSEAVGFKMVRFFPRLQGWDVDYAPFALAAEAFGREKLPLMLDVDQSGMATRAVDRLNDYPGPVILAGIVDSTVSEAIVLMRSYSNVYVDTSGLLATGAIKLVAESVGAERILFGSGAPAKPMASGLAVLKYSGLSEEHTRLILGGNAKRLLVL
jgi:predicted TIM-barrel fold metal-dependent hydrolase